MLAIEDLGSDSIEKPYTRLSPISSPGAQDARTVVSDNETSQLESDSAQSHLILKF